MRGPSLGTPHTRTHDPRQFRKDRISYAPLRHLVEEPLRLCVREVNGMRLEAFRVQNYKKIRDTGWVSCRDLTCFVGKNESGKSATFRALSKLNPSDGEKLDGLKEFPRRRYTDEFS